MKNINIRLVVMLGAFSIASIVLFQLYWMYNTYSVSSSQFNQRVKIALYSVAERMADFSDTELPYNVVSQVTSNYFVVNLATHIDAGVLEHYLQTVFQQHDITLACEYAIYNCETNAMIYGNYLGDDNPRAKKSNPKEFEKMDDLVYYFGIIFPARNNHILQSINIWMISSLIVLLALLFFSYSIFIILKQKRLSEIQKDFIDNMTHEFKTPISSIAIASHVLQEPLIEKDPGRLKRYAQVISEQNTRLQKHVERVLLIASVERSKDSLLREQVDFHALAREVAGDFPLGDATLELQLQAGHSLVFADKHHLESILYNLLDNAIKYSGEGARVVVSTALSGKNLIAEVADNGPGIEKKYLKRIFDKFFRVPSGNIHTVKGFGLGLYYVKRVAEDHGWKISARSIPGNGTVISLEMNLIKHE